MKTTQTLLFIDVKKRKITQLKQRISELGF